MGSDRDCSRLTGNPEARFVRRIGTDKRSCVDRAIAGDKPTSQDHSRRRSRIASGWPTIRELCSWINTAPLARIYPFGWQGASATVVNMKSPNKFEVGATTGVVPVSRGVLHLESVPGPVWDAEAVRHIIGGLW
jgi:hypothetical protein